MKIRTLIVLILLVYSLSSSAQAPKQFRIGFQINRFQNDFGMGIHVHSPSIMNLNLVLKGNLNYLDHLDKKAENHLWSPYGLYQLGVKSNSFIASKINLYGEGGFVTIHENQVFSTNTLSFGGYGLFGFEFYFTEGSGRNACYFIELGGNGVNGIAEKLAGKPIYANGFLISVGFRL